MFRGVTLALLALLMLTLFGCQAIAAEKYTVASDCTWPPMEMLNAQKQPEGYSTDYIRAVAKAAGFEVDVRNIAWDGIFGGVATGKYDIVASSTTITPERQKQFDFSDPYFEGTYGLFVREGSPYEDAKTLVDLSGASVVGQKGTKLDDIIDEIPGVVHMTPLPSVPNVLAALQQGAADAATYNMENEAAYLRSNLGIVPVRFDEGEGFPDVVTAGVGVAKGNDDMLAAINGALADLSDAERQELWDGAVERQPE